MSRLPLDQVDAFVTAARLRNLTRAAEAMYLTVSALSHRMRLLEQRLGHKLLARGPRGVELTPDGQRLFDAIRPGQALWRMNALVYDDPTLFQPRPEGAARPKPVDRTYMRCERQCLVRLPASGAVLFSIHTYLVRVADLSAEDRAGMEAAGL